MTIFRGGMSNQSGIYEILNTVNGKRYIGQATNLRKRRAAHLWHLRRGVHHSGPLQRAWLKYGEDVFVIRPLLICSESELDAREQQWFDEMKPEYNIAPVAGSNRGTKRTVAQRAHLIGNTYSLGFKHPPEFGAAVSARNTGRHCSREHVEKSSAARTGAKRTDEMRQRMSDAQMGKKRSAEHCAAMSAGRMGMEPTPEHCANVSKGKRAANDAKSPPSPRTLQRRAEFDACHPAL